MVKMIGRLISRVKRQDCRLKVQALFHINMEEADPDRLYVLQPVLTDGEYRLELPAIHVDGTNRYYGFREAMLARLKVTSILRDYGIYRVLKAVEGRQTCRYKVHVPYVDWMAGAWLDIDTLSNPLLSAGSEQVCLTGNHQESMPVFQLATGS
jgi:hypothetical protein